MRLAIIDPQDNVLRAWPTVADAHADLADQLAAVLAPHRWQGRKRRRLAAGIRLHLLGLQAETIRF